MKGVLREFERAEEKDLLANSRGDLYLSSPVSLRFLYSSIHHHTMRIK